MTNELYISAKHPASPVQCFYSHSHHGHASLDSRERSDKLVLKWHSVWAILAWGQEVVHDLVKG